jgi:integrase
MPTAPKKPRHDFPLFAHLNGQWAKKIKGKLRYFGPWDDPDAALERFENWRPEDSRQLTQPRVKPAKPFPDFPLYAHKTGRWAKKIRRRVHYFGRWDNPQAALNKYLEQKDDLMAGRVPRALLDELTIQDLVNEFLASKDSLKDSGEIGTVYFDELKKTCGRIVEQFGLRRLVVDVLPRDFEKLRAEFANKWSPVTVKNELQRVRSVFKYGYDAGLIDRPVRFGPGFKSPSQKSLRLARAKKGLRLFDAKQIHAMLRRASVQMKAMILLAINAGFGNRDVAMLPMSAIDFKRRWVEFPRPKTGIERRCPLWPETVAALREAIKNRPEPKNEADAGLVFITVFGHGWAKNTPDNPISKETAKLLATLKIKRPGLSFYSLRHGFQTIGGEAKDREAVSVIMGHAPHVNDMSAVYREGISDERRLAVTDHIRAWLFGRTAGNAKRNGATARGKTESRHPREHRYRKP